MCLGSTRADAVAFNAMRQGQKNKTICCFGVLGSQGNDGWKAPQSCDMFDLTCVWCFIDILDACVDKAKVEESEKKAAEFSRKVSPTHDSL